MVNQLSSYVIIFPTPDLRALTMAAVIRQFLSTFPRPEILLTDYGNEFSSIFSTELKKYNILHHEGVPQRSQGQGSAELAVKLTKMTLTKLVGMHSSQGRDFWSKMLPHVVQAINSTHPYQSRLSRIHLLFSPMHHTNETFLVSNPVLLQSQCYEQLARTRLTN